MRTMMAFAAVVLTMMVSFAQDAEVVNNMNFERLNLPHK